MDARRNRNQGDAVMDRQIPGGRGKVLVVEVGQAKGGDAPRGCSADSHDQAVASQGARGRGREDDDAVGRGPDQAVGVLEEHDPADVAIVAGGTKHAYGMRNVGCLHDRSQLSHRFLCGDQHKTAWKSVRSADDSNPSDAYSRPNGPALAGLSGCELGDTKSRQLTYVNPYRH